MVTYKKENDVDMTTHISWGYRDRPIPDAVGRWFA